MSPAPEWTLKDLQRQVARLQDELDRVRSGQPQEQPHRRDATAWLGATLLIVGTWALSAAASATTSTDLEARVRALEGLVRRGPRGNVEIAAPLEVVSGTGNVIMRVGGKHDGGAPVVITTVQGSGGGVMAASTANGVPEAAMAAAPERGVVSALDPKGVTRAQLSGGGAVVVFDPAEEQIAGLVQGMATSGASASGERIPGLSTSPQMRSMEVRGSSRSTHHRDRRSHSWAARVGPES